MRSSANNTCQLLLSNVNTARDQPTELMSAKKGFVSSMKHVFFSCVERKKISTNFEQNGIEGEIESADLILSESRTNKHDTFKSTN